MTQEVTPAAEFRATTEGAVVELPYAGIKTFLKREHRRVEDVAGFDAAVLGIPFDGGVSNRPGARYGPEAIRQASAWWAYLSGYKGGLTNMRTREQVDYEDLSLADCGDVPVFPTDLQTTAEGITAYVATLAEHAFPVVLGGDHFGTYPAFRGFAQSRGSDRVGLVQIDAHSDTVADSPVFGEAFHGSSTQLISELPSADYESMSQVAIRGYEGPEFFEFAEEVGLTVFTMADVERRGVGPVIEDAVSAAAAEADTVYVTFDIDAVDPSVAPATGTPEPGGLGANQALTIMEVLAGVDVVGAVDLMEVAPPFDPDGRTSLLAANLLVSMLERRFAE